ncbi:MAG: hypothetical protein AVDCRST_MAG08-1067, partial [uncultured Acetobacteraceae bacterium]
AGRGWLGGGRRADGSPAGGRRPRRGATSPGRRRARGQLRHPVAGHGSAVRPGDRAGAGRRHPHPGRRHAAGAATAHGRHPGGLAGDAERRPRGDARRQRPLRRRRPHLPPRGGSHARRQHSVGRGGGRGARGPHGTGQAARGGGPGGRRRGSVGRLGALARRQQPGHVAGAAAAL